MKKLALYDAFYSPGATALVSNDDLDGPVSATGPMALTAGLHRISITFFQKEGLSANAGLPEEPLPLNNAK